MDKKNLPVIIAGPTASGKTDVALALAALCGGEIISVDSRQVYKLINVGTAAPKGVWKDGFYKVGGVNYRLVDFLDLNETFDVSRFSAAAGKIVSANPGGKFIFAGGTGMYMQGYFCGMDDLPPADKELRAELALLAEQKGRAHLHSLLASVDAASAAAIPPGNIHRVIRALELYKLTGKPASALRTGKFRAELPGEKVFSVYLDWEKSELEKRILKRTELIFEPMVKEAELALKLGYAEDCPGLKSLGYREAISYLKGDLSKEKAMERITVLTRQYAKRQRTWFRRYENMKIINPASYRNETEIAEEILLWKER